jgi:hypothetical protein
MPIDRGIIDQQLQALGESSTWWDQREFRDLPAVLDADEQIRAISRGQITRLRAPRRKWLIVVTNRRLLFLRSGRRTSWRQLEMSTSQITGVRMGMGVLHGRVIVQASGLRYRLLVSRADAYKLSNALASVVKPKLEEGGFGPTRIVRRMVDHVLALPAATLNPNAPAKPAPAPPALIDDATEKRVSLLEEQVHELQQQVDFLEKLLQQRQMETLGIAD